MSISEHKKSRGRPSIDSELLRARVERPILDGMDTWIAQQPDPKPSRPEAIRVALKDWLTGMGILNG